MGRLEWWVGVLVVTGALLVHALVPRYTWQHQDGLYWLRLDRWSGSAEVVLASPRLGRRFPLR